MPGAASDDKGAEVDGKIKAQRDKVRQLKTDKADKKAAHTKAEGGKDNADEKDEGPDVSANM